ncbi:MAG: VWA domain-containing protein [Chitinophagales bacterium]
MKADPWSLSRKPLSRGFNEIVQTVKGIEKEFPEQEHFISLITFNGLGNKLLHFIDPAGKLEQIDSKHYHPDASTPLYNALGFSISKLRQALDKQTDYNVLVTILTDGEENASKEYSGSDIKKLIDELKLNRWTLTYIGADHDVEKFASSISMTNTMTFQKDEADMKKMFVSEMTSRSNYSKRIRMKEATSDNFYETK